MGLRNSKEKLIIKSIKEKAKGSVRSWIIAREVKINKECLSREGEWKKQENSKETQRILIFKEGKGGCEEVEE